MDFTFRAEEVQPRPCAIGLEIMPDVVIVGDDFEILEAINRILEWVGPVGSHAEMRDEGPTETMLRAMERDTVIAETAKAAEDAGFKGPHYDFSVPKRPGRWSL